MILTTLILAIFLFPMSLKAKVDAKKIPFYINFGTFSPQEDGSCFSASGKPGDHWKGKPQIYLRKPLNSNLLLIQKKAKDKPVVIIRFEISEESFLVKEFSSCQNNDFSSQTLDKGRTLMIKCLDTNDYLKIETIDKGLLSEISIQTNGNKRTGSFYPQSGGKYQSSCKLN